ncbi:EcsC family protein [Arthrobacter sp. SLBN-100]|uniref:EcsC family protein n=1 Tax=Arthrobacter sp. SLBN-100 TaxID=2768450 RepID=UPI001153629E|nr:EcsC family protein [Arthrobacter sp. SLBN-100]TQJ69741.1 EcsC family protein [Arthrobacter sp. SLBN-100]
MTNTTAIEPEETETATVLDPDETPSATAPEADETPTATVPEPDETPTTTAEKAAHQLQKLVATVVDTGVGPLTGSIAWAEDRLARVQGSRYEPNGDQTRKARPDEGDDIEKAISRLILESVEAASVNGFVTGLGGFIAMPLTVPANMAGALVINARLAAAIAYLRGYDPKDPHVRTVVTLIAVGSNAQQIAKTIGIKVGQKVAMEAIKKVPIALIREINKKVGFMLLAKYGTKRGLVVLAKGIPLVGGVVGGAVDATMTSVIGRTARAMFRAD